MIFFAYAPCSVLYTLTLPSLEKKEHKDIFICNLFIFLSFVYLAFFFFGLFALARQQLNMTKFIRKWFEPRSNIPWVKRSSGWLQPWDGLLFAIEVLTTCAEAIFRVKWTHVHLTTLTHYNVKDKDELEDRPGALYKIKCSDCQAI